MDNMIDRIQETLMIFSERNRQNKMELYLSALMEYSYLYESVSPEKLLFLQENRDWFSQEWDTLDKNEIRLFFQFKKRNSREMPGVSFMIGFNQRNPLHFVLTLDERLKSEIDLPEVQRPAQISDEQKNENRLYDLQVLAEKLYTKINFSDSAWTPETLKRRLNLKSIEEVKTLFEIALAPDYSENFNTVFNERFGLQEGPERLNIQIMAIQNFYNTRFTKTPVQTGGRI